MIPSFKLYFYPFLHCIDDDKEYKLSVISSYIAQFFKLTKYDLEERTKKGSSSKHASRVNYCASYLKKLGLVKSRPQGIYSITAKGKSILNSKGESLTRDDLRELPEYLEMQRNSGNPNIIYIEGHYNKAGKFIPGYWCNINNVSVQKRKSFISSIDEENT